MGQTGLQYNVIKDQYGNVIGQVAGNGLSITITTVQLAHSTAAPVVTTGTPTEVTGTTATLQGMVNPGGLATTYHFEYGTTTNYGSNTGSTNMVAATTPLSMTLQISGLKAGTTYHVRLVANNSAGPGQGGDVTFVTPTPPTVTMGGSSYIDTGLTLNGAVNPEGSPTSYHFEWGPTASYGSSGAGTASVLSGSAPVPVTVSIKVPRPGLTYHYRLVATNAAGTTSTPDATAVIP
jgi:hypothetical protein